MRLPNGELIWSPGPYNHTPHIRQAFQPLSRFAGGYPLIGSWVVADRAASIGVREDTSLITRDTSRFIPHVIR